MLTKSLITLGGGNNKYFAWMCNYHDACYSSPGKSQATCDKELYDGLLAVCSALYPPSLTFGAAGLPYNLAYQINFAACTTSSTAVFGAL